MILQPINGLIQPIIFPVRAAAGAGTLTQGMVVEIDGINVSGNDINGIFVKPQENGTAVNILGVIIGNSFSYVNAKGGLCMAFGIHPGVQVSDSPNQFDLLKASSTVSGKAELGTAALDDSLLRIGYCLEDAAGGLVKAFIRCM